MPITYTDKVSIVSNPNPDINKVTAADMNEIKSVVNTNETALGLKVPTSRTLTIDGTTFDLSANRSWTTSGGTDKFPNIYNVTLNGLVGDGSTDNSAALTTLIGSIDEGSLLYFPTGDYQFLTSVTINKAIRIIGDGFTSIIGTSVNNITILDYDNSGTSILDISIRDIKFFCDSVSTPVSGSSGLRVNTSHRLNLDNVFFGGFYKNITLLNPVSYVFNRLYCNGWVNTGLDMRSSGAYTDAGDGSIVSSYFIPTLHQCTYSIYHENGGGLKIVNSKFNYDASPLTRTQYHYYYEGTGLTVDLNISNCSFENYTVAAIRMGVSGSGVFEQVAIVGNDIGSGSGALGIDGILIADIDNGIIVGNTFFSNVGGTDTAITLSSCDNWLIDNQYEGFNENLSTTGCTNINVPVNISGINGLTNDNIVQVKSGAWEQRTIAQLITDLQAGGLSGSGDVVGPASATDGMTAVFDGTSGTLLKESPAWVNWGSSLSVTGFSSTSVTNSYYHDDGRTITFFADIQGTSNATGFTFQLPVAPNAVYGSAGLMVSCVTTDGAGGGTNATGRVYVSGSSTTVQVDRTVTTATFQNSGPKAVRVTLIYMK